VADRLGVSQATVLRAVARGTLKPASTTPGGHHRFRVEDVEILDGAPSPPLDRGVRLISTGEAARLLAVSQHTVIRACREGRLKADETTPGGHRRFSEERIRRLAPLTNDLLRTGGAALALGLTADKLRRAVGRGVVTPASVTPGGHRRFATSDISFRASHSNGNAGNADGDGVGHGTA
jgi:excisionase family DNA binding protein